jgi:curli production assembly/transport component CsgF
MQRRLTQLVLCYSISFSLSASELTHQFNSPSFNGVGYSSHVLSIEQLEATRKKAIKDAEKAALDQALRDAKNTNLAKFMNNLESRIYAQLSKQLADQLFSENGATQGTMEFQGTTINWVNLGSEVQMTITNTDGTQTIITVPIGSFGF